MKISLSPDLVCGVSAVPTLDIDTGDDWPAVYPDLSGQVTLACETGVTVTLSPGEAIAIYLLIKNRFERPR